MSNGRAWTAVFIAVGVGVVVTHLVGLDAAPPGLYADEATIGSNAWSIAHHGVDQNGNSWPLLFGDFGPIGTYLVAPLTLLFPLTPALTRVPAALIGISVALVAGLLAWRLTRSRAIALLVLLEAAFEPWFFHTARQTLEADLFTVLCFLIALCALAGDGVKRLRNCVFAGTAIALAPLASLPGRFFAVVMLALILTTHYKTLRWKRSVALVVPPLITTVVVLLGTTRGAARFADVSVFHQRGLLDGIKTWAANYVQYFSPDFLFVHGDPNLRHSSGFGGLLFVTALPILAAGVVTCVRGWGDPMRRLAIAGLAVAPLAPALTEGISARRGVVFLPFLVLLFIFGWQAALSFLRQHVRFAAVAALLVAAATGLYFADYAVAYPARSARAWDTGQASAMATAVRAAGTNRVFVSGNAHDLLEEALFALQPAPGPVSQAALHIVALTSASQFQQARPGDVAVMAGSEVAPAGFHVIDRESVTGPVSLFGPPVTVDLIDVYQRQ
jgi:hypothetical protein